MRMEEKKRRKKMWNFGSSLLFDAAALATKCLSLTGLGRGSLLELPSIPAQVQARPDKTPYQRIAAVRIHAVYSCLYATPYVLLS
jgi:hypothetical protein